MTAASRFLRARLPELLFLAFATVVLSWHLGEGSLPGSDDAIYAQAAREALQDGRWLDVTWQGRPLFEKGPVLFWMLQASQAVLGPTDLAVRVPGVVAGVAVLALLMALARALGASRGAAITGAGLALATNLLVFNARRPMTDVPGLALGLAGFLCVLASLRDRPTGALPANRPGAGRGCAIAGGVLLGLSALVKVVAPVPFVLALLVLQADRAFQRPGRLALALGVAAAVALPWHVAMVAMHGTAFLDTFVGYHLLRRASAAVVGDGPGIYAAWFAEREGGTSILLLAALLAAIVPAVRGNRAARAAWALLACAGLPLLASRTALPHYLVPLLAGLGLAGAAAGDVAASRMPSRWRPVAGGALGLALLALLLGGSARDLESPDYGPGTKAACEELRAAGEANRLAATVDLHDPAVAWYCDRPVEFLGLDPGFLAATAGIPMLQGVVAPLDAARLRDLASRNVLVMTVPVRLDALDEAAARAGVVLSSRRDYPGRVLVAVGSPAARTGM